MTISSAVVVPPPLLLLLLLLAATTASIVSADSGLPTLPGFPPIPSLGQLMPKFEHDNGASYRSQLHLQQDSGPEAMEIIKKRGFIGHLYTINSRDNTPISLYHVINPFTDRRTINRFPVLMHHGAFGDAAQLLGHSELARPRRPIPGQVTFDKTDTNLAFHLLNNNFDLYMMDARGTNLNNRLVAEDFNPMMGNKYWNFSLDEQALQDLPQVIDFVLEQTGEAKLQYVGYSESTLFMFGLLSTYPQYQEKIASFVAMAPVTYISHATGTGLALMIPATLFPDSMNFNYVPQMLVDTVGSGMRKICQYEAFARTACNFLTSSLAGVGSSESSHGFYSTSFKSVSLKSIKHFMQLYTQQRFGMYDYGPEGNMRAYGQATPPDFNLANIHLPRLILFRGAKDLFSGPEDQARLIRELGTKPYLDFNYPEYDHLDFWMAKDIIEKINVPAARAMLAVTHQYTTAFGLPFWRDPIKLSLPKRYQPDAIVIPDGTRNIEIKSNLVNHMIEAFTESMGGKPVDGRKEWDISQPLTNSILEQPLKLVQDVVGGTADKLLG